MLGSFMRHADPGLAEVMGHMGWDYLLFDGEHSPASNRECENLARVCEITGVTSIYRVPSNAGWMIGQCLDTGIQGIQIPMVNTVADAQAAVAAVKYSPQGNRGLAAARAAIYGQKQPFVLPDYVAEANRETMLVAQIETAHSLENLAEIVKVPGIDVIFIGPSDLSLSLGVPGDLKHPKVQEAFDFIAATVAPSDKALGVLVQNAEGALAWRERGARYIVIVMEALLGPATREFLKAVRAA